MRPGRPQERVRRGRGAAQQAVLPRLLARLGQCRWRIVCRRTQAAQGELVLERLRAGNTGTGNRAVSLSTPHATHSACVAGMQQSPVKEGELMEGRWQDSREHR